MDLGGILVGDEAPGVVEQAGVHELGHAVDEARAAHPDRLGVADHLQRERVVGDRHTLDGALGRAHPAADLRRLEGRAGGRGRRDAAPVGMCGSGLVDAVAQLVSAGLLDHSGRFVPDEQAAEDHPALAPRLVKVGEERVFVLAWRGDDPANAIYLSQRDVRELQFAKASIATGWNLLCRDLGIAPEDIAQVLLAGSFGSYLSAASAVKIGLVPKLPLTRIVSAGNVAGEGAKIVALSVQERAAAAAIVEEVEYVELSGRADFNDLFVDQLSFPV